MWARGMRTHVSASLSQDRLPRRPPEPGSPPHRSCPTPPSLRSRRPRRRPQRGSASCAGGAATWPEEAVPFPDFYKLRSEYSRHGEATSSGTSRRRDEGGARCAHLPDRQGGGDSAAVPSSRCRSIGGGGRPAPPRRGRSAPGGVRAVRAAQQLIPPRCRPRRRRDLPPHEAHLDPPPLPWVLINFISI